MQTQQPPVLDRDDPNEIAREFMRRRAAPLVEWNGGWFEFDTVWRQLPTKKLRREVYKFLDNARAAVKRRGVYDIERFKPKKTHVNAVLDALSMEYTASASGTEVPPLWLDGRQQPDPAQLLVVKNGYVELDTGRHSPQDANLFAPDALPYKYDPQAQPSEWLSFLHSLWPGDQESIDTLQEIFGYIVSGDTRHDKIFLLLGVKRAGKTTIQQILEDLVGEHNVVSKQTSELGEPRLASEMMGKKLAVVPDARFDKRVRRAVERLLSTSGRGATSTRAPYSPYPITARPTARFVIVSNEEPNLHDPSGALAARYLVLWFGTTFEGHEDTELYDRLCEELPGILNWSLEGLQRLRQRGRFVQPASGAGVLTQIHSASSHIEDFVEERCILAPDKRVVTYDLYREWCQWCAQYGLPAGDITNFGKLLNGAYRSHIGAKRIPAPGRGGRLWGYEGIGLRYPGFFS